MIEVWAPRAPRVRLRRTGQDDLELTAGPDGWWSARCHPRVTATSTASSSERATTLRPDPRSRRQPHGVHGASAHVELAAFPWTDEGWTGRQLAGGVIYELHIGTFTAEGTLDAARERLGHLRRPRCHPCRAASGQRLQRHLELGLRRRALVRGPRGLRRPARLPAVRRRLPCGGARGHPGRRLQPSRAERELPARVRALPARRPSQHLGRLGRPRSAGGARLHRARTR